MLRELTNEGQIEHGNLSVSTNVQREEKSDSAKRKRKSFLLGLPQRNPSLLPTHQGSLFFQAARTDFSYKKEKNGGSGQEKKREEEESR